MFERGHLQDNIFPMINEQSCWGAKLFSVSYSAHEMEVNFSGIYKKKQAQRTQESNHTCTRLCSRSGAMGDCGIRGPDIDLGSTDFSGQAGRIHKKKSITAHGAFPHFWVAPLLLHSIRCSPSMCLCAHFHCGIKEQGSLCTEAGFVEGVSHAASKRALTYKFTITHPHRDPEMSDF